MNIYDQMYKILTNAKEHEKTTYDYITPKDLESWMDHITVQEHVMQHMRDYAEQQITKLSEALSESRNLNIELSREKVSLQSQVDKITETLKWYTNEAAEQARQFHFGVMPMVTLGERARRTLESYGIECGDESMKCDKCGNRATQTFVSNGKLVRICGSCFYGFKASERPNNPNEVEAEG